MNAVHPARAVNFVSLMWDTELSYGIAAGNHIGATLVHKLAAFAAAGPDALSAPLLPALVRKFRDRVDVELPGLYDWFADSSLHVTLRSLKD